MIGRNEPEAVVSVAGRSAVPLLIVADHAGRAIPEKLNGLGLGPEDLGRHIAWDIGAADIARHLAARFSAPALLSAYSRLVIDCNRHLHDPASITATSDGTQVPGNAGLSDDERQARQKFFFRPYHDAIDAALDRRPSFFLSIHTMTRALRHGPERPQAITVCRLPEGDPVSAQVLEALRQESDLVVGDNDPYALDLSIDYTVPAHAIARGLPYLMVEFRQDLVADRAAAEIWAARLADVLERLRLF
ncbi:MAG: N-formylglutamate amidohydrolase [Geminicoccaceae bacterium]